jgi:hypothetical protein
VMQGGVFRVNIIVHGAGTVFYALPSYKATDWRESVT